MGILPMIFSLNPDIKEPPKVLIETFDNGFKAGVVVTDFYDHYKKDAIIRGLTSAGYIVHHDSVCNVLEINTSNYELLAQELEAAFNGENLQDTINS
jgi:hypothetical protein